VGGNKFNDFRVMLCGPHTMQNKYGLWTEIMHYALLYNIIHI